MKYVEMKWLDEHKLSFWRRPKFGSAYAFPISNCRQLSSARILAHRRRFWRIYRIPEFRKCVILLCRFLICRCQIIKRWHARNSEAKSFVFAKVQVGNVWNIAFRWGRQVLKFWRTREIVDSFLILAKCQEIDYFLSLTRNHFWGKTYLKDILL